MEIFNGATMDPEVSNGWCGSRLGVLLGLGPCRNSAHLGVSAYQLGKLETCLEVELEFREERAISTN